MSTKHEPLAETAARVVPDALRQAAYSLMGEICARALDDKPPPLREILEAVRTIAVRYHLERKGGNVTHADIAMGLPGRHNLRRYRDADLPQWLRASH